MSQATTRIPSVDIILGVYNKPHLVHDCIRSLLENTQYPNWRVLLIDDASDAMTQRVLTECAGWDPRIRLVRNSENRGFIGTYNFGMQSSNADYVLLLNSDTILTPQWLDKLVAIAESSPRIGMVNPLSNEFANLSIPMAPGASYLAMNEFLSRRHARDCFDIVTCVGYCLLIRRAALEQLGYLDVAFGTGYCEDSDLHMRFTANGWRVVAAADTYIYHQSHGTFGVADADARFQKNIKIFRQRWGSRYDQDYRAFQASGRLTAVQNQFIPSLINDLTDDGKDTRAGYLRKPLLVAEAARNEVRYALRYPRRAFLRWRDRALGLVARHRAPAAPWYLSNPGGKPPRPTRAYYERFSKQDAPSVVFLLHELGFYGGCQRVVQLVNQLILKGIDARLAVASPVNLSRGLLQHALFEPMVFENSRELQARFPRCDALVVAFWPMVKAAQKLLSQGRARTAVSFLQDFDPWFNDNAKLRTQILQAYSGLEHRVVTSDWLSDVLREHRLESKVIPLGFDALEFYPSPRTEETPLRIIAMARPHTPYRGFATLSKALEQVHRTRPEVEIALFGCDYVARHLGSSLPVIDHGVVTDRGALRRRYSCADIFIDASDFQGFGLPALEAMACQLACVLTEVGGVNQYGRDGLNALMVPPRDPERCTHAVLTLIEDVELRQRLGMEGRKTVERMTLEDEARAWLDYLAAICPAFQQKLAADSRQRVARCG